MISAQFIGVICHWSLLGETEQQEGDNMTKSPPHTHLRTPLIEDMVRQPSANLLMDCHMLLLRAQIEKITKANHLLWDQKGHQIKV